MTETLDEMVERVYASHDGGDPRGYVEAAILAERERCVAVAEHLNGWGADCGAGGHAMHIAKIIRGNHAN